MNAILNDIDKLGTSQRLKEATTTFLPAQPEFEWRYTLSGNVRFPFQYYAELLHGSGTDTDELLVISVECADDKDEDEEYWVVSADITGKEGIVLAEASKKRIPIPSEQVVYADPQGVSQHVLQQFQLAIEDIEKWIMHQRKIVDQVIASV